MQLPTVIHMVSRSEVVMSPASLTMSILAITSLASSGIPRIARAEDLPRLQGRSRDAPDALRLKLVPSLRLQQLPAPARGPVRSFGPAVPDDVGPGQAMFRGGGVVDADADGRSQPRGGPSWRAIGSVTLPWRHWRLIVGHGPDGSFSLML
jgi:hypothetical protein